MVCAFQCSCLGEDWKGCLAVDNVFVSAVTNFRHVLRSCQCHCLLACVVIRLIICLCVTEGPASPPRKKAKKLKQAQLTAEGGFLSSQRPTKGTSSQPSDSGQAAAAAATAAGSQPSTAELALQTMQQLLQLQPMVPDAAAAARIAAIVASLGPNTSAPGCLAAALGFDIPSTIAAGGEGTASDAADAAEQESTQLHKVRLLQLMLQGLLSVPGQPAALVAIVSQQVVAWLPHAAQQPELCAELLPALLLAMVAAAGSAAADAASVELHMRVWQEARDYLQVKLLS
jgi:hypothetical protein